MGVVLKERGHSSNLHRQRTIVKISTWLSSIERCLLENRKTRGITQQLLQTTSPRSEAAAWRRQGCGGCTQLDSRIMWDARDIAMCRCVNLLLLRLPDARGCLEHTRRVHSVRNRGHLSRILSWWVVFGLMRASNRRDRCGPPSERQRTQRACSTRPDQS